MIYDKIALMLPTYGRSETLLPQFMETALNTAEHIDRLLFVFCVNETDKKTQSFLQGYNYRGVPHEVLFENFPSPHLAKYFNMMYAHVKKMCEPNMVATMLGDDMEFETQRWDSKMLALINQYKGVGVFWANDCYIAHERCPVNLFVTQDFVEATEHPFMCEDFAADLIDSVWQYVGSYTKTSHYDSTIHIRHNHNRAKPPNSQDQTFQRLALVQKEAHKLGKPHARKIAAEIAEVLKKKGLIGDSIC